MLSRATSWRSFFRWSFVLQETGAELVHFVLCPALAIHLGPVDKQPGRLRYDGKVRKEGLTDLDAGLPEVLHSGFCRHTSITFDQGCSGTEGLVDGCAYTSIDTLFDFRDRKGVEQLLHNLCPSFDGIRSDLWSSRLCLVNGTVECIYPLTLCVGGGRACGSLL